MKPIVIYHSADFDGIFCREIARKFLPEAGFFGWNHGDSLICLDRQENRPVYILDLSPECLTEKSLWYEQNSLIWIDHHKTAIEKFSSSLAGYRIDGVAACRLAWQWFSEVHGSRSIHADPDHLPVKEKFIDRSVDEPLAVRLAGEYDIWDKRDPRAELFQHGLKSRELNDITWKYLLGEERTAGELCVEDLLESGRAIQYFKTKENEDVITSYGFTIQFEGLTFLACNHARYNSLLFTAGLKPEHDACFGFKWTGKKWEVSLYHAPGKEHHDLSVIAAKHGGGGHRGACGFRTDKLPFL